MQNGVGTTGNEHHTKGILKQENFTAYAIVLALLETKLQLSYSIKPANCCLYTTGN
jgi:hypothetical protein